MVIRGKKLIKEHIAIIAAVIVIITAFILLWWYCAFLPSWIKWNTFSTDYGEGFIKLDGKHLCIYDSADDDKPVWRSKDDMAVQSVIIKDIDRDGFEELMDYLPLNTIIDHEIISRIGDIIYESAVIK